MERVYAPGGITDGSITLDRDEAHHLTRVRRVSAGAEIVAFDGLGNSWLCRLTESTKTGAWLDVIEKLQEDTVMPGPEIWLGTAVPKGDRFDWIVEKATELGVDRLVPLVCERSVVEPRPTKLDRLRRTVIEACKQSGRDRLMEIADPVPLKAFLAGLPADSIGLFADRGPAALPGLASKKSDMAYVLACVGPEGGWTVPERAMAAGLGWHSVGLGPHILRIETAAIAMAACVRQCFAASSGSAG